MGPSSYGVQVDGFQHSPSRSAKTLNHGQLRLNIGSQVPWASAGDPIDPFHDWKADSAYKFKECLLPTCK